MNEADPVYLYILMRTDLASMNAGKAVAQGAHAANACVGDIRGSGSAFMMDLLREWETQTPQTCGTTVTLGVNAQQMYRAVKIAQALRMDIQAGIFHDPTYPLRDGEVLHLIPLDTCGYVMARKSVASLILGDLHLMA